DADAIAEGADGARRIAAPPQPREGRHARVVPAVDEAALDELEQLALADHRVVEVEAGELVLMRPRLRPVHRLEQPVVELAVVLELERAERVRDALDGIRE